uniref:uncharacterized protein LOC120961044 n=1 Tax=Anopheles coluzzii TaxID=1518534 RepID=UPI0020FFC561|nr:uncharacterized protein LOC120961044 [Anopheles coluzzii]
MKLSFEARFCRRPAEYWTYPLNFVPLSSGTRLSAFCSRWLPSEPADVRICLHSCCILLLINSISTFVCLLARRAVQEQQWLHYTLIIWQIHCLLAQLYLWHAISKYHHVAELVYLIPLCLALLSLDACYSIAFHGGLSAVFNSLYRTAFVVHHAAVWLMPLLGLTCAVHREYADCIFIS